MKNQRDISIELLRIVAMLMVVSLHYLGNSGVLSYDLKSLSNPFNYCFSWFAEAASLIAVNLFFLISGYCLNTAVFKTQRLIAFWLQVLFYSIVITLIFMLLGRYPDELKEPYSYAMFFTPFFSVHYWFANCYGMLYIIIPFINVALKHLGKRSHLIFFLALFILFVNANPLVFFNDALYNDNGYGIRWALCMYVLGAFIKRVLDEYMQKLTAKRLSAYAFIVYLSAIVFQFVMYGVFTAFNEKSAIIARALAYRFEYNSIILCVEAAALFICFATFPKKKNAWLTKAGKVILFISPLTFGVYLLHNHYLLRGLWKSLWKADVAFEKPTFVIHYLFVVLIVFAAGCIVEFLRQKLFSPLYGAKWYNRLYKTTFGKLDNMINKNL